MEIGNEIISASTPYGDLYYMEIHRAVPMIIFVSRVSVNLVCHHEFSTEQNKCMAVWVVGSGFTDTSAQLA